MSSRSMRGPAHPCSSARARGLVVAVVLLTGAAVSLDAQDVPGMPASFRDVISLRGIGTVAISPEGDRVAYTVRSADWENNRFDSEIWLAGVDRDPYPLTRTADESSTSPAWSPDGRWLAFLADRGDETQVHLIDPRGGEAWPITEVEDGVSGFAWAPSRGGRMVLSVREPAADRDESIDEAYGDFEVEDDEWRNAHLWRLDVAEDGTAGDPERLTEGDFHVSSYAWSPDASRIAVVRQPDSRLLSFMDSDLYLLSVADGDLSPLVTGPGPDGSPVWSPDGRWILFSEFEDDLESLFYLNGELARVPADGGEIEVLTRDFDENPGGVVWTEAGIRFVASQRTDRKLYALDPESGEVAPFELPAPVIGSYDFTPDGRALAVELSGPSQLSEVYLVGPPEEPPSPPDLLPLPPSSLFSLSRPFFSASSRSGGP